MNSNITTEKLLCFGYNLTQMNLNTYFLVDNNTHEIMYLTFYNMDIKQWHIISYCNGYFDYGDLYYENIPEDKERPVISDVNIGQYYMTNEFTTEHIMQFLKNAKEYENQEDAIPTNIRKNVLKQWITEKNLTAYFLMEKQVERSNNEKLLSN